MTYKQRANGQRARRVKLGIVGVENVHSSETPVERKATGRRGSKRAMRRAGRYVQKGVVEAS